MRLTQHAVRRMHDRGITPEMVAEILQFGRMVPGEGPHAIVYVVTPKEVKRYRAVGIELGHCEWICVVCDRVLHSVITVYRQRGLDGQADRRSLNPFQRQKAWQSLPRKPRRRRGA